MYGCTDSKNRKRSDRPGTGRRCAFTMIELLVAMAVLALLGVLVAQLIASATDVVGQGRKRFEIQTKARAALELMARDLSQGVYRKEEEVRPFVDNDGKPALAFFTKISGPIGSGQPVDYRKLSFVVYRTGDSSMGDDRFSLWRGSIHAQWEDLGSYPELSGITEAMPFSENTTQVAYSQASIKPVLEPVLDGVVRMEMRFLGTDGKYHDKYETDPAKPEFSKAVAITLLVIDENTRQFLLDNPSVEGAFQSTFFSSASKLNAPPTSDVPLSVLWEDALNDGNTWDSIPQRLRNGIYTFERIIPLR